MKRSLRKLFSLAGVSTVAGILLLAHVLGLVTLGHRQFLAAFTIACGRLWLSYRRRGQRSGTTGTLHLSGLRLVSFVRDLDTPLGRLTAGCYVSGTDACNGFHVYGGIGSGKTSGSGRFISGMYLRAGYGGVVTCVKSEEVDLWQRYAAEHGRCKSLVLFDEDEGFNFLNYELARQGMDGIGSVTECLMRILEAAKRASPMGGGQGGDSFWMDSTRQVLRFTIPAIYAASGGLSIADIIRFLSSAPTNLKEPTDPDWQRRSFMYEVMDAATRRPRVPMSAAALRDNIDYWAEQFPAIPDKTRGNILISVTSVLDRFRHGRLQRAFCGRTTIVPEMTFHGSIILLAMPTLTWNEDGIIAQQLFKYMWQRAVLSRNSLPQKHRERPLFLYSDEAQETVSSYDGEFLSMCRGSKCSVCYLTQSLPTYYSKMGGASPHDDAHMLVGKFRTQVFHANACPDTNEYASRVIGKVVKRRRNASNGTSQSINLGMSEGSNENTGSSSNRGSSFGSSSGQGSSSFNHGSGYNSGSGNNWGSNRGKGSSENVSEGYSETTEYAIEPGDFARGLKTGGRQNGNEVTGVWFQSGRIFSASGDNTLLARFKQ